MVDCLFCRRNVELDLTVNVDLAGVGIVTCCDECWARGEEAADVPDPITEEEAA